VTRLSVAAIAVATIAVVINGWGAPAELRSLHGSLDGTCR
jgi:hypothetical protein